VAAIGHTFIPHTTTLDPANHNYDINDFFAALKAGNLPAVSFLKASAFQDGHAGYSDPLDEQQFLVTTINRLQGLPEWSSTAIVIAYDDSDGWYDHVMGPIVSKSNDPRHDALFGSRLCGKPVRGAALDRCGYGPRLPLLVISPYARVNHVDHRVTDQTSVLRFIEDNWGTGRIGGGSFDARAGSLLPLFDFRGAGPAAPLRLDPATGLPLH
jgi:phospholipase C